MQVKLQAIHGVSANAPKIIAMLASEPLLSSRVFVGSGVPSGSTLLAGNGKYCAAGAGYIVAATLSAVGVSYVAGNVLTIGGGTPTTAAQVTVDVVDATGKITDWHLSRVGIYTAYPATNPAPVTGGAGSGATFILALQPPDLYFDKTGQKLYACVTPGTNAASTWVPISGDLSTVANWI
jgi:hypothetical protein